MGSDRKMIISGFLLALLQLNAVLAMNCVSDSSCPGGMQCLPSSNGYSVCTQIGNGVQSDYPSPPSFYCNGDRDCAPTQVCVRTGQGLGNCQDMRMVGCRSNSDCSAGQSCVVLQDGQSICQINIGGLGGGQGGCRSNNDCPSGQSCVRLSSGQYGCQINIGGFVPGNSGDIEVGGVGLQCQRDSDCSANQRCADYFGQRQCIDASGTRSCSSSADCSAGMLCAFSSSEKMYVCVNPASSRLGMHSYKSVSFAANTDAVEESVPSAGEEITQGMTIEKKPHRIIVQENIDDSIDTKEETSLTVFAPELNKTSLNVTEVMETRYSVMMPKPAKQVIDPAALPCEFDYQCRMGESCSGEISLVDRAITVCQYDLTKVDRQCIYHADCLHGQQCIRNENSTVFVCKPSMEATLGTVPCMYDYECSGGEKCINISQRDEKFQVFRCRPSPTKDPRRDQLCRSNAECPFQQVCRRVAGVTLCVDVTNGSDRSAVLSLERKVVNFIQNLLFSR
ncbi:hypothetical protein Q1695_013913 [Nippostrongylus brasiliensis]|nr:hypothetical protein Q1695_013913 [Nippostrongylus brasiliensis]